VEGVMLYQLAMRGVDRSSIQFPPSSIDVAKVQGPLVAEMTTFD
jgi:hypothetical protein